MSQAYPSLGQLPLLWGKSSLKSTEVVPEALMLPLPGGFRLHQKVVALYELLLNSDMKVPLGSLLKTWTMSRMSRFSPMFLFFCAFLPSFWKFPAPSWAVSKAQLVTSLEASEATELPSSLSRRSKPLMNCETFQNIRPAVWYFFWLKLFQHLVFRVLPVETGH